MNHQLRIKVIVAFQATLALLGSFGICYRTQQKHGSQETMEQGKTAIGATIERGATSAQQGDSMQGRKKSNEETIKELLEAVKKLESGGQVHLSSLKGLQSKHCSFLKSAKCHGISKSELSFLVDQFKQFSKKQLES